MVEIFFLLLIQDQRYGQKIKKTSSIFCRSCLTFSDISLLVRFSRIATKNVEQIPVSCLTRYVGIFELVSHSVFLLILA